MMDAPLTLNFIMYAGMSLMGVWGFVKVISEIVSTVEKAIVLKHEKEKEPKTIMNKLEQERNDLIIKYDQRLDNLEKKIDSNYTEMIAKTQELKAEVFLITRSLRAILEGQIEQGCDGPVKKAKEELDEFLMSRL